MKELSINIYDKDNKVIRTEKAQLISLKFGVVRSLMEVLKIDDIDNTMDLLKSVYGVWDELKVILARVFPGVTDEEWDNVELNELVPTLLVVIKASFAQILTIPTENDPKN
jgi:hypothetical protein